MLSGLWTALKYPEVFLILLVIFLGVAVWLLPRLWCFIKIMLSKIGKFLGLVEEPVTANGAINVAIETQESDQIAALERLQQLRDKGALTPQEFEQQKNKILREN